MTQPLNQPSQQEQNMIPQTSEEMISRNKASALEVLLRLQNSLHMEIASQVERTIIVTRTEEL